MSVEILDLIKNYKIVCYDDNSVYKLLKNNWALFSYLNTELTKNIENDKAIEIILNDKIFLNSVAKDIRRDKAIFFYMNKKMDKLLKDIGMPMLLPPYDIQERLGNKLYLSDICKKLGITSNEDLTFKNTPGKVDKIYTKCQNILGLPFIIQGALGVSGEDTFLVNAREDIRKVIKYLRSGFKATKYISNNIPVSVHVCVLDNQIIVRGPFLQLVGLPELSSKPFQFTGNDTNQSLFNQFFINRVRDLSFQIGEYVKAEGYRGILGIDYLWDKNTDTIYPQELNTRLVGLTRLLTGIQKDQSIFPDLLRHIEAFSRPTYSKKCNNLRQKNIDFSSHDYSQIIICNNLHHNVIVSKYVEPSIYQIKDGFLRMAKRSLFLHDMKNKDILITQAAYRGKHLLPGDIIAKIILKRSAIKNGEYNLESKVIKIINIIKDDIIDTYVKS